MGESPVSLVVEDSQTQAQELAARLYDCGLEVLIANDGPAALRIVDAYKPDVVVLDLTLPTMSGHQICDRLKRDPATTHIPVIMLTAASSPADIQAGYRHGADAYIPKGSFAINHLISTLQRMGLPMTNGVA